MRLATRCFSDRLREDAGGGGVPLRSSRSAAVARSRRRRGPRTRGTAAPAACTVRRGGGKRSAPEKKAVSDPFVCHKKTLRTANAVHCGPASQALLFSSGRRAVVQTARLRHHIIGVSEALFIAGTNSLRRARGAHATCARVRAPRHRCAAADARRRYPHPLSSHGLGFWFKGHTYGNARLPCLDRPVSPRSTCHGTHVADISQHPPLTPPQHVRAHRGSE